QAQKATRRRLRSAASMEIPFRRARRSRPAKLFYSGGLPNLIGAVQGPMLTGVAGCRAITFDSKRTRIGSLSVPLFRSLALAFVRDINIALLRELDFRKNTHG